MEKERFLDSEIIGGSDKIEFVSGRNAMVAVEKAGGVRELFGGDRVVAFINTDNGLAKLVLFHDNKFYLKVRPNVTRVEAIE